MNSVPGFLVLALVALSSAAPDYATQTRPPSYPLAVRNPYTNFWLAANNLPGNWPSFWTTKIKGWTGMVRVDGETFVYMGNPNIANRTLATQTATYITPTQTIFEITAGSVNLNVTFFSPVEYEDIQRQSIPLSYVFVAVGSNDGAAHNVQLYMDITGEWAADDTSKIVTWDISNSPAGLKVWSTQLETEYLYGEHDDYPTWGKAVLATSSDATYLSGADTEVRNTFVSAGVFNDTTDTNFRCASCSWPTFGFAHNLQAVTGSRSVTYVVGLVRENNANFLGTPQNALWLSYWPTFGQMLDFFWGDVFQALTRANALDIRILNHAFDVGGQYYADILTLSLRQSYAGNEFSGNSTHPIYFQKEISSGGFMQTVDVIYPATPMFYYLGIKYLKLLLDPLFHLMENKIHDEPFAMHDIGNRFPNATGQGYGLPMPIEESGNMIMMVGDIIFHPTANPTESLEYANAHFSMMAVWADYLYHNCLYPVNQLSTDDFIGHTELNSGLALKGILAMKTFAKIAEFVGDANATEFYNNAVAEYVPIWINESMHNDGDHLKMEYNVTNGYQFKYNAFHDKLLGLNVIPQSIYEMEAAYYLTKLEPYGIPFVSTHDYTKSDWEMWTAAAFGEVSPQLKEELIEALGKFLRYTPNRVPFTDWYVTATSNQVGFQARPVQGGHFALLALELANKKTQ